MPLLEVVRDEKGRIQTGSKLGPYGRGGSPRVRMLRRIDLAVERLIDETQCAETFAEQVVAAISNRFADPELRKMALERVWPAVHRHELTGSDGGAIEIASADLWARLAEDFGREVQPDPALVIDTLNTITVEGAD